MTLDNCYLYHYDRTVYIFLHNMKIIIGCAWIIFFSIKIRTLIINNKEFSTKFSDAIKSQSHFSFKLNYISLDTVHLIRNCNCRKPFNIGG